MQGLAVWTEEMMTYFICQFRHPSSLRCHFKLMPFIDALFSSFYLKRLTDEKNTSDLSFNRVLCSYEARLNKTGSPFSTSNNGGYYYEQEDNSDHNDSSGGRAAFFC